MRLILGSGSPRRLELLSQLGLVPDAVRAPDIDETPRPAELPKPYAERMAREKAAALGAASDEVVLCADTTVAVGRRILGKPRDETEAATFLKLLSGRRHRVVTAITVATSQHTRHRSVTSTVRFKVLSDAESAGYLATGDWRDKAGGYAIQGPAAAFIPWIQGSFTAIVGLPLHETAMLLAATGYLPR